MSGRPTWRWWLWLRRAVQLGALAAFLAAWPAAWAFQLDPLTALAAGRAGTITLVLGLTALAVVALTLLLGRFFCGWLCPLGTLLDLVRRATAWCTPWRRGRLPGERWLARGPQVVLALGLAALLAGAPVLAWMQPFALLERALVPLQPALAGPQTATWFRPGLQREAAPGDLQAYRFVDAPVRTTDATSYRWAALSAGLLALVLALELLQPRFWCRTLCPTGGLLGLLSRWALVRRLPGKTCGACQDCVPACAMGAFDQDGRIRPAACTACLSCVAACTHQVAHWGAGAAAAPVDLGRRGFLVAAATGTGVALLPGSRARTPDPACLRPPGAAEAGDDRRFLEACIRCGACIAVCPTHALQPALLEDGPAGIYAPRLVPRSGACDHGCTACGEACPSQAIPLLALAAKRRARIGQAVHDHRTCLPWAEGAECRVCQEHCPVQDKAITLRLGRNPAGQAAMLPTVDGERCIGCGTCEYVCPLEGRPGIRVVTRASADSVRRELQPDEHASTSTG